MQDSNRQYRLRARPKGPITPDTLELVEAPLPRLQDKQVLARVRYLSMDPAMRIWMADRDSYLPPVPLGEVMRCLGLAEVIESLHPNFKKGDKIMGFTGLQEYAWIDAREAPAFQKLPNVPFVNESAFLGLLGITGLTAYFGMMDIAKPNSGETMVVSAAAGATGSVAGQIGKIHGCRVVGIAGSEEKCNWLRQDLGFDAAINYKEPGWKEQLAAATSNGVDIDFENVGGEIMHAVLQRMNSHGRVVLCGLISGYNQEDPALESFATVLVKRLQVRGFIVTDYSRRFVEAATQLGKWKMFGKIKDRETIIEGFDKVPEAFAMLFAGQNIGKLIVKI